MKIQSGILKHLLIIISAIIVAVPSSVSAQTKKPMNLRNYDNQPYHFGFILGYNQMSYSFNYIDNEDQGVTRTIRVIPLYALSCLSLPTMNGMDSR